MTRTRAMTAGDRYRQAATTGEQTHEQRDSIAHGMDPDALGQRVVEAIERNEPYIFPHGEFREEVAAYFAEMLDAFPNDYEIDPVRKAGEERRAQMTAEAKAIADAIDAD